MKIKSITIYGYGKLENVTYDLNADVHVFYGENEAGKSTLMSFIHSMLFGFPTKQQNELRYEPKIQHKYGGKLVVDFPHIGLATIERVKGKAAGDVTVTLANGRRGQEELLEELLQGVDKGLFQSIFSFNLQGLQNVHQLKSEELGRFLFSTGAVGSDLLLRADMELQKELELRFRPNGKKPLLNEKLTALKEKHQQLKIAESNNSQYEELLKNRGRLEESYIEAEKKFRALEKESTRLQEWGKIVADVKEKEVLEKKLERYAELTFPSDGLKRWEAIKEQILHSESRLKHLQRKIDGLQVEQDRSQPNFSLLQVEEEILHTVEKLPVYEQHQHRRVQLLHHYQQLEKELIIVQEKLHIPLDKMKLEHSNTSVFFKEQCMEADAKQRRLKEQRNQLDRALKEEQDLLERLEIEAKELGRRVMPDQERNQLEQQIEAYQQVEWKIEQKAFLEREANSLQKQLASNQKRKVQNHVQWISFYTFFLLLMIVGIFQDQFLWIVLAIIAYCGSIVFHIQRQREFKKEHSELMKKRKFTKQEIETIKNELAKRDNMHVSSLKELLKEDNLYRDKNNLAKIKLEQQNENYERILQGFDRWEREYREHQNHLTGLANELNIPPKLAAHYLYDSFLLVEEWKAKHREKKAVYSEIQSIEAEIDQIKKEINALGDPFLPSDETTIQWKCFRLKKLLKEEMEKRINWSNNNQKIQEFMLEIEGYQQQLSVYEEERDMLFSIANVDREEKYREAGMLAKEKKEMVEQLAGTQLKLDHSSFSVEDINRFKKIQEPMIRQKKIEEELSQISQFIKETMEEIVSHNYEIARLENGGTYTENLHAFKQLKAEFQEEVKEWGKYSVAKHLLSQTVEQYKNKQLPKMLHKAEEYLFYLTEGNYNKILPREEGMGFWIENNQRIHFEAKELSQGTMEQVYVSIRLALAQTFYHKYSFPIIIDDSFVNFDEKRTNKVIQLLKTFKQNQLLFFTCHSHLLMHFQKEEIIHLPVKQLESKS